MGISEKITDLIDMLNKDEDYLLIGLLEQKIKQYYSSNYSVTDKEITRAAQGIKIMLENYLWKEIPDERYKKLDRFVDDQVNMCKRCEYSIYETHHSGTGLYKYKTHSDSERCKRCLERIYKINDVHIRQERIIINKINKIIDVVINDNNDMVILKAIINKVTTKINKLKTNNYETSKH